MKRFFLQAFCCSCAATYVQAFVPNARLQILPQGKPAKSTQLHESRSTDAVLTKVKNSLNIGTSKPSTAAVNEDLQSLETQEAGFNYGEFAKKYPFRNNIAIASTKTAAADLIAQLVIAQTPVSDLDWDRTLLFFTFGAVYLGGFQYLYQVNIFKKLFDVDAFTSQTWGEKLRDQEGLKALAAQTVLDLTVLTLVYLPAFYIFKAGIFSGSTDPGVWTSTGLENYTGNFAKDEADLLKVWLPADLICFSVPLYLRLPVRHVVSFMWTAYLSFARGGH